MQVVSSAKRVCIVALVIGTGTLAACGGKDANQSDSATSAMSDTAMGGAGASASAMATPSTPAMTDANIVAQLDVINDGEVEAGEMASKKARAANVKSFARDMVKDHRAMHKMVDSLAKAKNVSHDMTAGIDSMKSAMKAEGDRMSKMSGAAFDSAYVNSQVMGHQQALDALNRAANAAQDADLRTAIQQAVPKVQAHLDRAKSLMGGGGDSTMAPK